jgi:hypothetical protein
MPVLLKILKTDQKSMIGSGFSGFLLYEPATLLLNQLLFGPGSP